MRNFKWLRIDKHSHPNTPVYNDRTGERMLITEVTEGLYQYDIDICAACGKPEDLQRPDFDDNCDDCHGVDCDEFCGPEICQHCGAVNPGSIVKTVTNEDEIAGVVRNQERERV